MSLQFVIGNAGSGKSTYLYQRVIEEAIAHPQKNYLVIVPEQFTMHTQEQLVAMHPKHAIMNIDVLSFDRMAYRIFDELGTDTLEVLEETGKNLLLRKVAQEQEAKLYALGKNMKRPGYIAQVKSLISEFAQYNITPDHLEEIMSRPELSESLRYKGADLVTMYRAFQEKIAGTYITTEQILQKFLAVSGDSKILRGATIVFDGFTGFTPIQNQVIEELLRLAETILVTITCDIRETFFGRIEEQELFAISKKTMAKLVDMTKRSGVTLEDPILLGTQEKKRFVAGGFLEHLEQNLFRAGTSVYKKQKASDAIRIVSLKNPRQELLYAASEITKAVRTEGRRYSDFAIVCANLDMYRYSVPAVMEQYHVPYFLDVKSEIVFQPMIEFIYGLLMVFEEDFSYESVMRLLRTGMSDLLTEEIDQLENYILASGIRGHRKYEEPFVISPQGYTPEMLVELNEIRMRLVVPLQQFAATVLQRTQAQNERKRQSKWLTKTRKVSVEALSYGIYEYLTHHHIQERLEEKADFYEEVPDAVKSGEYRQIYGACMDLLDKVVCMLGTEEMTVTEYREILASGFESIAVGMIPPAKDCVVIGDMERTRLSDIRTMYLIGANDGAIPKALGNGGILSQLDREKLMELDVEVAPSDRQKAFMQRFYLYFVMTKPARELIVTYTRVDGESKAIRRSYLIQTLLRMFPELSVTELEELPAQNRILTEETAQDYYVDLLRQYVEEQKVDDAFLACLAWEEKRDAKAFAQLRDAAFYEHKEEKLSKAALDAVYGMAITESVSRLEQYARCAYAYFLKYGLGLMPRGEHAFEVVDMGNLYHEALEAYAKRLEAREDVNWYTVDEEQSNAILREAIDATYQTMTKIEMLDEGRDRYILWRMERTLQQTVHTLLEQVRKGSFVPHAFEVDFREVGDLDALRYQLDEMHTMRLRGKIDRVDLYRDAQKVYVKIVDYKSGVKDIDFSRLYDGLQVQLVLYMDAMEESLKKQYPKHSVEPGAMLYYHIDRPVLDAQDVHKLGKEEAVLKALQMKGVVNADMNVIEALHHGLEGYSDVIPVNITKDGSLGKTSHALTTEEFAIASDYVRLLMQQTGKQIIDGEIACKPYRKGQENGCLYCEYHGICGFDTRVDGFSYRKLSGKMNREEVLSRMEEDLAKAKAAEKNKHEEGE